MAAIAATPDIMHPVSNDAPELLTHESTRSHFTPPASEESAKHDSPDASSSDLSEMDIDDDDDNAYNNANKNNMDAGSEDDVVPDHYYGGGRVPVFKPVRAD